MIKKFIRFLFGEERPQLAPNHLIKPLRNCMEKGRKQMPNGSYNVHNRYTISLSEADYTQLNPLLNDTRLQLEQYITSERDRRKYGPKGWPLHVEIVQDTNLKMGHSKIESFFDVPGAQSNEQEVGNLARSQLLEQPKTRNDERFLPKHLREERSDEPGPSETVMAGEDDAPLIMKTVTVGELPKTAVIRPNRGKLIIESGPEAGITFDLTTDQIIVGREGDMVIRDDDEKPQISRRHFTLTYQQGDYLITDTSTNGTFVNGNRISGDCVLSDGDVIKVGDTALRYVRGEM